jgi:AAA domain
MATERKSTSGADFEKGLFELDGATEFYNILIYGDSGAGKTVLAGSLPGRVLFLAGEPGYISAARMGGLDPGAKGRLIPDTSTASAAILWLENGGWKQYDWIVVDGFTTMGVKFLLGYAAEAFDANPAKRAHRNLPDKPDYYNTQNFMKSWAARFIDLPCNVLFTGHAMRPEDENGEILVYPGIQGKGYEVSNYISGLMHGVWYMAPRLLERKGETVQQRRLLFEQYVDPINGTRYFAKDQTTMLGRAATVRDTDNPDGVMMPDLISTMNAWTSKSGKKPRKPRG